ncbi:MAG: ABC transporter permease [Sporolactobacillus sp.]|jgi:ABC-2 type transport system permease protein|nr:ABC transporter permease [Sporolactobacillus sp.]
MPIFNLCLKIFRRNWAALSLYVVIFLLISVIIAATSVSEQQTPDFTQEKAKVALIDHDRTVLTEGFRRALGGSAEFVNLPDQTEKLQDALFFRKVTYILRIPHGFSDRVLQGETPQMNKTVVPGSMENAYLDVAVNRYWNLAHLYVDKEPRIDATRLADQLNADMAQRTSVTMKASQQAKTLDSFSRYYFNFASYALAGVLLMGISTIMIVFNRRELKWRNFCSPLSANAINGQLILANLTFALLVWAFLTVCDFLFDPTGAATPNMVFFALNLLIFTACTTAMSFLTGHLVRNLNAMSAVCNVLTLGPCFISGVFVPQEFLNDSVLKIASFTPVYWYVQANTHIARLTEFHWGNVSGVVYDMAVMLAFTAAFIALALVVAKRKRLAGS